MGLDDADWVAAVVSALFAVVSGVVAVFARRDANRSAHAAERSASAAEQLTKLEQQRRHEELTPDLRVKAKCRTPGSNRIRLKVTLAGPDGLDRLDQITVRVLDDNKDHTPVTVGGPTEEQIAATIWGPYRFVPGVDGADEFGRAVLAFPLARGDSRLLEMEPTLTPPWWTNVGWWRKEYAKEPIRLEITSVRDEEPPWRIPAEVDVPQPRFSTHVRQSGTAFEVVAHNIGTAPARKVRFHTPPRDPMTVHGEANSIVETGHRISAYAYPSAESQAMWVELSWIDQLEVPRRKRIPLVDEAP